MSFDNGSVILDLWLGDVNTLLPEISSRADAIYLDGFAPSKNPDMWQPELFTNLARLSYSGTTVATFTSAGLVKRGLRHGDGLNPKGDLFRWSTGLNAWCGGLQSSMTGLRTGLC